MQQQVQDSPLDLTWHSNIHYLALVLLNRKIFLNIFIILNGHKPKKHKFEATKKHI